MRRAAWGVAMGMAAAWTQCAAAEPPVARVAQSEIVLADGTDSVVLDATPSTGGDLAYWWQEGRANPVQQLLPGGSETMPRIDVCGFSAPGVYQFHVRVKDRSLVSRNEATIAVMVPGLVGSVFGRTATGEYGVGDVAVRVYTNALQAAAMGEEFVASAQTETKAIGRFVMLTPGERTFWVVAIPPAGSGYRPSVPVRREVTAKTVGSSLVIHLTRDRTGATAPDASMAWIRKIGTEEVGRTRAGLAVPETAAAAKVPPAKRELASAAASETPPVRPAAAGDATEPIRVVVTARPPTNAPAATPTGASNVVQRVAEPAARTGAVAAASVSTQAVATVEQQKHPPEKSPSEPPAKGEPATPPQPPAEPAAIDAKRAETNAATRVVVSADASELFRASEETFVSVLSEPSAQTPVAAPGKAYGARGRAVRAIEGTVRDLAGKPVAEAAVTMVTGIGGEVLSDTTDGDGKFRVSNVPCGRWMVQVLAQGCQPEAWTVDVRVGTRSLGFVVAPWKAEAVLTGTVVSDKTGRPMGMARVVLMPSADAFTDALGRYRFGNLAVGDYEVRAEHRNGMSATGRVSVRPGEDTLELRLK